MSGKHTPSPWRTSGGASFTEVKCADGERRGRLAANVYHDGRPGFVMARVGAVTDNPAEVMANTHLVVAAPDLLDALKECAEGAGFQYMKSEARDRVSAAIAKAEGQL